MDKSALSAVSTEELELTPLHFALPLSCNTAGACRGRLRALDIVHRIVFKLPASRSICGPVRDSDIAKALLLHRRSLSLTSPIGKLHMVSDLMSGGSGVMNSYRYDKH